VSLKRVGNEDAHAHGDEYVDEYEYEYGNEDAHAHGNEYVDEYEYEYEYEYEVQRRRRYPSNSPATYSRSAVQKAAALEYGRQSSVLQGKRVRRK